jgi:uncharacterized protein (TIGR03435 family)
VLQAPEGTHGTWEELKGRAVVLEFWATWCGGCVDNIPHLNELAEEFRSRPVQFISITDETDVEFVKRFLARHPMRGWVAFDAEAATFKNYGIEGRPQTLLISRSGFVQAITDPVSVTSQVLEDLLADKPLNFPELRMSPLLGLETGGPPPLAQVLIRPAAPVAVSGTSPGGVIAKDGRFDSYGMTLRRILSDAYEIPETRVDAPDWCSDARFDVSVVTPQHEASLRWQLAKQVLETAFHLQVHKEMKETSVYILRKMNGQQPKLRLATTTGRSSHWNPQKGEIEATGVSIGRLADIAHFVLNREVFDETGLTGRYDFDLKWDGNQPSSLIVSIREQLGLELLKEPRKLEHLVVDSIKEARTW